MCILACSCIYTTSICVYVYVCSEKSVELAASMIVHVPAGDTDVRELLATQARAVADEYFALALKATSYLAR